MRRWSARSASNYSPTSTPARLDASDFGLTVTNTALFPYEAGIARPSGERRATAVRRLLARQAIPDGTELTIVAPAQVGQDRDSIRAWLDAEPSRARVRWYNDGTNHAEWAHGGQRYGIWPLIRHIIETATGKPARSAIGAPGWYRDPIGRILHRFAEPFP